MFENSRLLSRKETAVILEVKQQTLAVWACNGRYDLKFVKIGKRVLYKSEDIKEFIERNTKTSTA
jgi:predicted site-specific integrase-resolvase